MFLHARRLAWAAGFTDMHPLRAQALTFFIGVRFDFVRSDAIGCHSDEDSAIVVELNGIGKTSFSTLATLHHGKSRTPVIQSTLFYAHLNKESRTRQPIPDWFIQKYSQSIRNKTVRALSVQGVTNVPEHSRKATIVLTSDHMDHYGHLNNYFYVEFASAEIDKALAAHLTTPTSGSVRSLEVTFQRECKEGDALNIFTWRSDVEPRTWFCHILRQGLPASRVKVTFHPHTPSASL